jgi:NAD(P)-dependent dehydrogenase (short-subunit alcohol dehydrogenase family)
MKYQIRQMLKNGGGSILNNSSIAGGRIAAPGEVYGASKAGVVGLTKSAARNYGRQGIRVNAICPGVIETPMVAGVPPEARQSIRQMIPMHRFGEASELAEAAAWLLSDRASYVTATELTVDGGIVENFLPLPPLED